MNDNTFILVPGAFNPPTIAHIKIWEALLKKYPNVSILYLPSRDEYITEWKEQVKPISYLDRCDLLSDAITNLSDVAVCTIEKTDVITGKTYDVVNWFKEHYKNFDIVICLGEDKLKELPRWYKYEQLVSGNRFIIMTRDKDMVGLPMSLVNYAPNFNFMDFPYSSISSTKIREAYLNSQLDTVKDEIPANVYDYLKTHNNLFKECDNNV